MSKPEDSANWPETELERRLVFGARLKALREGKKLSVNSLAQATRIGAPFIVALESGRIEDLPGDVFGKGFVRSIVRTLGAESEANSLLQAYDDLLIREASSSVLKVQIKNKPTKDPSDHWLKFRTNLRSLIRSGVARRLTIPVGVALVLGYVFLALPAWPVLSHHLRKAPSDSSPKAKFLDLSSTHDSSSLLKMAPETSESTAAQVDTKGGSREPKVTTTGVAEIVDVAQKATTSEASGTLSKASDSTDTDSEKTQSSLAKQDSASEADPAKQTNGGVLELVVLGPVRVKIDVDKGPAVVKELTPDTYKFSFNQRAGMMIYDAAQVKLKFNGKSVGPLGNKGRIRRLSFEAGAPNDKTSPKSY